MHVEILRSGASPVYWRAAPTEGFMRRDNNKMLSRNNDSIAAVQPAEFAGKPVNELLTRTSPKSAPLSDTATSPHTRPSARVAFVTSLIH